MEEMTLVLTYRSGPHTVIAVGANGDQVIKRVSSSQSSGFIVSHVPAAGKSVHRRVLADGTGSESVEFEEDEPDQETARRILIGPGAFGEFVKDALCTVATDEDGKIFEDGREKGINESFRTGRAFIDEALQHIGLFIPNHTPLVATDTFFESRTVFTWNGNSRRHLEVSRTLPLRVFDLCGQSQRSDIFLPSGAVYISLCPSGTAVYTVL